MWIGKFRIKHKCSILKNTKKYNVISSGYVLNVYEEKGEKYHSILHVLNGEKENKKRFINSLIKDKTTKRIEVNQDYIYAIIEGEMIAQRYSKKLFFVEPIVHKKDTETWYLGSPNRRELTRFFENVKKIGHIEIIKLQKIKPPMMIQSVMSKLTPKQKNALCYAQEYGYYNTPRKISVKGLAIKLNVPRATLQEHLRKAEKKILNAIIPYY